MKIINKLQKISIEKAFYTYISFNLINMVLHMIGPFTYPLFEQMDFVIYLLKIAIMSFICLLLSQKRELFSLQIKLFKGIIALDIFELFISVFAYRYDQTYIIIASTFVIKAILDFCIFTSILIKGKTEATDTFHTGLEGRFKRHIIEWILLHIALLAGASYIPFVEYKTKTAIFILVFVLLRFAMEIFIIYFLWDYIFDYYALNISDDKTVSSNIFQRLYKRFVSFSAAKKGRICLYALLFISFLFMRNCYSKGDQQLTDDYGTVLTQQRSLDDFYKVSILKNSEYQYSKCNLMPSWSIFYHEKYGLINIETGDDTGAKYDNHLYFDSEGIAYDYDRHFIDLNAQEIIKVPYIVKARTSYRQELLDKLFLMVNGERGSIINGGYNHLVGEFLWSWDKTYFTNGVASYHTYYNDCFGLIRDDGTLITLPKYKEVYEKSDSRIFLVNENYSSNMDVINSNGESILDITPYTVEFCEAANMLLVNGHYLYSYDGRLIDEGIFDRISGGDTIGCFKRTDASTGKVTLEVYYGDAEHILSSDQYVDCFNYVDDNEELICLKTETKSGRYSLIDLTGNVIGSGNYIEIKYTSERDTFIGIDVDGRIDILHSDGRVIETDYISADERRKITDNILVNMQDDESQFNYIDLEGNLLEDWFTEDEK